MIKFDKEFFDKLKVYIDVHLRAKIIRMFLIAIMFLSVTHLMGLETRTAHQFILRLSIMVMLGLLVRNIWLMLFLWWTVFLFIFFRLNLGHMYIGSVFLGSMLYYLTKSVFRKEDVKFVINAFLWLVVANLALMSLQLLGYDFIYKLGISTEAQGFLGYTREHRNCSGFMGFKACMGMIMCMAIPLLGFKRGWFAKLGTMGLIVPIWLSQSSICIAAACLGYAYIYWYRIKRIRFWKIDISAKWIFPILIIALSAGTFFYLYKVDSTITSLDVRLHQWKLVLQDTIVHPIIGWGMDSFRTITEQKNHIYAMNPTKTLDGITHFDIWDNPHNLWISIAFEWGYVGVFLLIGYLRQTSLWFSRAIKDSETLALFGFMLIVLVVSLAQFPMWLARVAVIIIIFSGLYEVKVRS